MREWQVVFVAGFAAGYFLRWAVAKVARVIRGPWLVAAIALLGVQGCAGLALGIGLRTAGAIAATAHAANQGRKALEQEPLEPTQQQRARAKAEAERAQLYNAIGCLR